MSSEYIFSGELYRSKQISKLSTKNVDQHGDHNRVLRISLARSKAAHAYQKGCPNASAIEFHINSSVELFCRVLSESLP